MDLREEVTALHREVLDHVEVLEAGHLLQVGMVEGEVGTVLHRQE
jgi:hypothetical protein